MKPTRKRFFLAVNTGFVTGGLPDARCRKFYADRSGHGLYCSIVGNAIIPGGYGSNDNTAKLCQSPNWHLLARSIEARGARPGIQLATTWSGFTGMKSFVSRSSIMEIGQYRTVAQAYTSSDIENLFRSLHDGSDLAIAAGFRHIQLHAAHGYLFSLLIDRRLYPPADRVLAAVDQWARRLREHGVETSIRFSLRTGDPTFDEVGGLEFLDAIAALPVSYLDVSSGFYNLDKRLIYPSIAPIRTARRNETVSLAQRHLGSQFILSGGPLDASEGALPANIHIGICRDLIANADFLKNPSKRCNTTMKCHYFSRGQPHLTCGSWKHDEEVEGFLENKNSENCNGLPTRTHNGS